MEPRNYLTALARGWVVILVGAILGALVGYGLSAARPAVYDANASGIVSVDSVESGSDLWQTSNATIALATSYGELATTPLVTDRAAEKIGDGVTSAQVAGAVSATVPLESVNINVTASDRNPERAAELANATLDALQEAVAKVAPKTTEGEPAVVLHRTQDASAPSSPSGLSSSLLTMIGLVAGLGLGALVALVRAPRAARVGEDEADALVDDHVTVTTPDTTGSVAATERTNRP